MLLVFGTYDLGLTPLGGSESGLAVTRTTLLEQTGVFARMGRTIPTDTEKLARLTDALNASMRNTYYPDTVLGEMWTHRWSFMRPLLKFTTVQGVGDYVLPPFVDGIEGDGSYENQFGYGPILVRGDQVIRRLRESLTATGYPSIAATVPIKHSGQVETRKLLMLHPTPDAGYEVTFRYHLAPTALTAANPYPPGGPLIAEALIQGCRAAIDLILNDRVGTHHDLFKERLKAAVLADRRVSAPENLGRTMDPQEILTRRRSSSRGFDDHLVPSMTVYGTEIT